MILFMNLFEALKAQKSPKFVSLPPMYKLLSFFWKNNIPRWTILLIDVFICAFSLTLAFFLRFNFAHIPDADLKTFPIAYAVTLLIRAVTFFFSKTYKGVIRYTGSKDAIRILLVIIALHVFLLGCIISHFR
jgi:hypothetical protein